MITILPQHITPTPVCHPLPHPRRRYPNKYESIIGTLCDSLESLDEPEAKASMIWIIGEYAERIDNAGALFLSVFCGCLCSAHAELGCDGLCVL